MGSVFSSCGMCQSKPEDPLEVVIAPLVSKDASPGDESSTRDQGVENLKEFAFDPDLGSDEEILELRSYASPRE